MPKSHPATNEPGPVPGVDLQDIFDNAPIGIFTSTPEGRYISVNLATARMLGYDTEQELIESVTDIAAEVYADPADRAEFMRLMKEHGEVVNHECRFRRRDGTKFWVSRNVRTVKDQEGRIVAYQGFNTDITDRKRAEMALKESEEKYRVLVDYSYDLIWILKSDGCLAYASPSWKTILGHEPSNIEGKAFPALVHPDDVAGCERYISTAFESKKAMSGHQYRVRHVDGTWRWHEGSIAPVYADDGCFNCFVGVSRDINDRKQIEQDLKEKNKLLEGILDNIPDIMSVKRPDLRVVCYNKAGYTFLGMDHGQVQGRKCFELIGRKVQCDPCASREAMKRNELVEIEKFVPELGMHLCCRANPIVSDDGQILYSVELLRDITKQKQAEKDLRLQSLVLDQIEDRVTATDLAGRITYVNQAEIKALRYTKEELLGQSTKIFGEDSKQGASHQEILEKTLQDGHWRGEIVNFTKEGAKKIMDCRTQVIRDDHGEPIALCGIATDITDRKKAEQEQAALAAFVENSKEIIVVKDLQRRVMATNMTFVRAAGRETIAEMIGKRDAEIFGLSEDAEPLLTYKLDDLRAMRLQPGEIIVREEPVLFPDGEERTFLTRKFPICGANNEVVAVGIISSDVTERKRDEKVLVLAAKSEFLSNMSHELRTPFNGIMGMMQLLETTPLSQEQQEYVTLAIKSSERFTRLLSDILELSSIEANKMVIYPARFDLAEALESISGLFTVTAREKGVALECSMAPGVPAHVVGDAVRVKQVLFNLVGNALKFTEKGNVHVHLSALSAAKGGDARIMFSISDTGIGIPDHKFKDLFQPFTQVEGSYTRSYQGAGLGLVIVRRLVALMDGNINVESKAGQGTTVHVVLPFALPAREISETAHAAPAPKEAKKRLNILLAEDDPLNQMFMQTMLKKLGHAVTLANNGQEALDLLKQIDFDCILMDIQMPVMTGDEATRRIREAEVHGSRFNGSTVEETEVQRTSVGAPGDHPAAVMSDATHSGAPTPPTVNSEPLNREPTGRSSWPRAWTTTCPSRCAWRICRRRWSASRGRRATFSGLSNISMPKGREG